MFAPECEWTPPVELPDIFSAKTIAIDVETRDPDIKSMGPGWPAKNGEVVGYAVAVDGWSGYIPVKHFGGGNIDEKIARRWLSKVFESDADKIMHNAQYDLGWLKAEGFTVNGRIVDTMVLASLLDENRFSYSLNSLSYDLLNKVKSEKGLVAAAREFGVDPKGEMWKLPAMYVGRYAEADAELTLELWNYYRVEIEKQNLGDIAALELDLLPCLVDMTMRGVRVDTDGVERARNLLMKREKQVLSKIKSLTGMSVEIWAAQSLAKAFDEQGIPYPKTQSEKPVPSFTKGFLEGHPSELAQLVVQARTLNKMSGTFISSITRYCHSDGRIHGHINQIRSDDGGTVSGRISMNNPNLQQIPARDPEMGPLIRSLFLPEEGEMWASIDFSQQEPRILTHYAHVYGESRGIPLEGAAEFVEAYNNNPDTDFHSMVAEITGLPRKQAKTINLALMYGMGMKSLAEDLDIPQEEAKKLVKQYDARVPFVKLLSKGVEKRVNDPRTGGSLRSILGRKCRFDLWEPDSFGMSKALPYEEAVREYGSMTRLKRAYSYKALNRLIQASAADQTKKAMVDVYKSGRLPLIQIHDELANSVKDVAEAEEIANIMTTAVPLCVPNKVDIELGRSWGEAK